MHERGVAVAGLESPSSSSSLASSRRVTFSPTSPTPTSLLPRPHPSSAPLLPPLPSVDPDDLPDLPSPHLPLFSSPLSDSRVATPLTSPHKRPRLRSAHSARPIRALKTPKGLQPQSLPASSPFHLHHSIPYLSLLPPSEYPSSPPSPTHSHLSPHPTPHSSPTSPTSPSPPSPSPPSPPHLPPPPPPPPPHRPDPLPPHPELVHRLPARSTPPPPPPTTSSPTPPSPTSRARPPSTTSSPSTSTSTPPPSSTTHLQHSARAGTTPHSRTSWRSSTSLQPTSPKAISSSSASGRP